MTPPQANGANQSNMGDSFMQDASTAVVDQLSSSKPNRVFRNVLFGVLKNLSSGSLELHEAGDVFYFGEHNSNGINAKITVKSRRAKLLGRQ